MFSLIKHGIWASLLAFLGWNTLRRLTALSVVAVLFWFAPPVGRFLSQQIESRRLASLALEHERFQNDEQAKQQAHLRALETAKVTQALQLEREQITRLEQERLAKAKATAAQAIAQAEATAKAKAEAEANRLKAEATKAQALADAEATKLHLQEAEAQRLKAEADRVKADIDRMEAQRRDEAEGLRLAALRREEEQKQARLQARKANNWEVYRSHYLTMKVGKNKRHFTYTEWTEFCERQSSASCIGYQQ